jgi:hypothetical protein
MKAIISKLEIGSLVMLALMNAFRYSKIVSISDEAFGLLLIENYLEKWKIKAANVTAGNELVDSTG